MQGPALGFCLGFAAAAYSYHEALAAGPEGRRLFCFTNPVPSRIEAIRMFVAWANAHPDYGTEAPLDSMA